MIFKLDGGVENLLALTPVLVEWRHRFGPRVLVETRFPEVFARNPYVDRAGTRIPDHDYYYDLNVVQWHQLLRCVTELYAERILGDLYLSSWRPMMIPSKQDEASARQMVGPNTAAVFLDADMMSPERIVEVMDAVKAKGYAVLDVSPGMPMGLKQAVIARSKVFVGTDGAVSAIAMTTDVPAVVCYSYRDPCYFVPFRRGVPFEMVLPNEYNCDSLKICLAQNTLSEYAKLYKHVCPKERPWECRQIDFGKAVGVALEKIAARV